MSKFPYINPQKNPRRLEELSRSQQEDLVFDLINAISLVKDPLKSSLLLQDLLTAHEIKNISKRLRISKLLLGGKSVREIADEVKCSFATIAKVQAWLSEGGDGLKDVIKKLPQRRGRYEIKKGVLGHYPLPLVFIASYLNSLETAERRRVEELLKNAEKKEEILQGIQEMVDREFADKQK